MGSSTPLPNNLLPLLLNYRYTLITSLWGRNDGNPCMTHHGSLSQTDTNTPILQQIFIPFHDLCQLFSHPLQNRHLQCLSALRNRLQMVFILPATLHFIAASSSQTVLTHHPHICNFTVCQSFNCFSLFQTVSRFSISRAVAISVCVQDSASSLVITKCLQNIFPSWWILSSRSLYHHILLFSSIYLASPVGNFSLFTPSIKNTSISFSPSFYFVWHSNFSSRGSGTSLCEALTWVSNASLFRSLNVFSDVSHFWSKM